MKRRGDARRAGAPTMVISCRLVCLHASPANADCSHLACSLQANQAELTSADRTTKCAVLQCVPSSMLTALAKVQVGHFLVPSLNALAPMAHRYAMALGLPECPGSHGTLICHGSGAP